MHEIKLNAIAAMDLERGIGKNNSLPWSITEDWNYFVRFIQTTKCKGKINALIMGRMTWESIPEGMFPFKPCINIIVSSKLKKSEINFNDADDAEKVFVVDSIETGVSLVQNNLSHLVESIISVGGTEIYRLCMESPLFDKFYLTRVFGKFDCDVFIKPENFLKKFEKLNDDELKEDAELYKCDYNTVKIDPTNQIEFIFEVYAKRKRNYSYIYS